MSAPLLILVTGAPAAGKTTLARALAPRLRLPLLSKDDFKEVLFDSLGWSDEAWSKTLGAATWEILFTEMDRFLSDGASTIAESNFYPHVHRSRLLEMRDRLNFVPFEIWLTADPALLAKRNNERERHPGHHLSTGMTAAIAGEWARGHGAMELSDDVIRVDTGVAESVDLDDIVKTIKEVASGL